MCFRNWNRSNKFKIHVGSLNSAHNKAQEKVEKLLKDKQIIQHYYHRNQITLEWNIGYVYMDHLKLSNVF